MAVKTGYWQCMPFQGRDAPFLMAQTPIADAGCVIVEENNVGDKNVIYIRGRYRGMRSYSRVMEFVATLDMRTFKFDVFVWGHAQLDEGPMVQIQLMSLIAPDGKFYTLSKEARRIYDVPNPNDEYEVHKFITREPSEFGLMTYRENLNGYGGPANMTDADFAKGVNMDAKVAGSVCDKKILNTFGMNDRIWEININRQNALQRAEYNSEHGEHGGGYEYEKELGVYIDNEGHTLKAFDFQDFPNLVRVGIIPFARLDRRRIIGRFEKGFVFIAPETFMLPGEPPDDLIIFKWAPGSERIPSRLTPTTRPTGPTGPARRSASLPRTEGMFASCTWSRRRPRRPT